MVDEDLKRKLDSLQVTCTSTDCENGLHCFKQTQRTAAAGLNGRCRECGVSLVDWARVRKHDPGDADYTFEMLRCELYRHHYWHVDIDDKAISHARRKGLEGLRNAASKRIVSSLRPLPNPFDGRQTPPSGNSIYYAQHATAACCRKCVELWHGIPKDRELTADEVDYLTTLVMLYLIERLPFLKEEPHDATRSA